MPMRHIRREDF